MVSGIVAASAPPTGTGRSFAPIGGNDQWLRCAHTRTALDAVAEVVTLAAPPGASPVWPAGSPVWPAGSRPGPAGLAFDRRGCLYHGDPDRGQLQRVAWRPDDNDAAPVDLLAPPPVRPAGDFVPVGQIPGASVAPVALACDPDDHLFLLDGVSGSVCILDLADGRLVRTVDPGRPITDLAADGATVLLCCNSRVTPLLSLTAFGLLVPVALDPAAATVLAALPAAARPTRVAVGPAGERWILLVDGARSWAVPLADARRSLPIEVDGATDIELDGLGRLVLAGSAGSDFRRYAVGIDVDTTDDGLRARHYDGRGVVRTPDGGIGYWQADRGFRLALEGRRQYVSEGWVDCHALDSGTYQRRWGRVFVEACVPAGAEIQVSATTSDDEPAPDEPEGPSIARTQPANVIGDAGSLPPAVPPLVALGRVAELETTYRLHRRETGSEQPWAPVDPSDRFEIYEAPVMAPPGRYIWLRVRLTGSAGVAPRVRSVRVEMPGHDLLEHLPAAYRRDAPAADFLQRYLALVDGLLVEAEGRSARRDLLLSPFGAPREVLPWLASLVGLSLDTRWPETARRAMIDEAICLFRRRGTIAGLRRMLQIVLGCDVVIVEAFRFRGPGGATVGDQGQAGSVVGFDLRVGGAVGSEGGTPLHGTAADAYATHAHRFTVLIPRELDDETSAAVDHLLDVHRPAHTLVQVCTVGRGMRIGVGLHLEITTLVGPSAGFSRAVLGETRLGAHAVLGVPRAGVRPGGTVLDGNLVVDP